MSYSVSSSLNSQLKVSSDTKSISSPFLQHFMLLLEIHKGKNYQKCILCSTNFIFLKTREVANNHWWIGVCQLRTHAILFIIMIPIWGVLWWLNWLRVWLLISSQAISLISAHGSVCGLAFCVVLWFSEQILLGILCLPLSLPLFYSCLNFLLKINKHFKN